MGKHRRLSSVSCLKSYVFLLIAMNAESERLRETQSGQRNWRPFGPYLSERQWGTVREDYSPEGDVKERYYYLDNTPPHAYLRMLYKYPQDSIRVRPKGRSRKREWVEAACYRR
jgi:hypothetical protein